MTDYTKSTNFAAKDNLTTGDPNKRVRGAEIDDEYNNISTAISSKANSHDAALTGTPTAPTAAEGTNTTQLATTAFVETSSTSDRAYTDTEIANISAGFINNLVYPVGAIFTTVNNYADAAAVNTAMGVGTWARFAEGRTLVGVDTTQTEFDVVEETGGAKTHTLTEAEMPSHTHSTVIGDHSPNSNDPVGASTGNYVYSYHDTGSTGGDQPHNNLQPYITVYFWKRTA